MSGNVKLNLRLRILLDEDIAMGPGKAALLRAIEQTGSISQAAKKMNMSYRRAWQLVDTMNRCFQSPLVETQTGGTHGGGAIISALGHEILKQFDLMEQHINQVGQNDLEQIKKHLKQN